MKGQEVCQCSLKPKKRCCCCFCCRGHLIIIIIIIIIKSMTFKAWMHYYEVSVVPTLT